MNNSSIEVIAMGKGYVQCLENNVTLWKKECTNLNQPLIGELNEFN